MRLNLLMLSMVCSSMAVAGESGIRSMAVSQDFRPVLSFLGGYASITSGDSREYNGTNDTTYAYTNIGNGQNSWFVGAFTGLEHVLPFYDLSLQGGIEYSYYGSVNVKGIQTAGIGPNILTVYNYNYNFQAQQVLASAKLLTATYGTIHPYFAAGMGVAYNTVDSYTAVTKASGSVNPTPVFNDKSQVSFAYNVGLGIDADLTTNFRVGMGYRFSDLGQSALNGGRVVLNDYTVPVAFTLSSSHAYTNQVIAQISYVA